MAISFESLSFFKHQNHHSTTLSKSENNLKKIKKKGGSQYNCDQLNLHACYIANKFINIPYNSSSSILLHSYIIYVYKGGDLSFNSTLILNNYIFHIYNNNSKAKYKKKKLKKNSLMYL